MPAATSKSIIEILLNYSGQTDAITNPYTTETNAKQLVIIRLLPMRMVTHRKIIAEKILPIGAIDASHDTSVNDNGPVVNGVSSDFSNGKTGVNQPTIHPCEREIKFAKGRNEILKIFNSIVERCGSVYLLKRHNIDDACGLVLLVACFVSFSMSAIVCN